MLLSYLFKKFFEETEFLKLANISAKELIKITKNNVVPKPSYILENTTTAVSYFGQHQEQQIYRFHLKAHLKWLQTIQAFEVTKENRAKKLFADQYNAKMELFFSSPLGKAISVEMPDLVNSFSQTTWQHFLDGTYGVCTKTGSPGDIFLKETCVQFITFFINHFPEGNPTIAQYELLMKTVDFLDTVESEFAPHEVQNSSRQRCIIDVRERFSRPYTR